MGRGQDDLEIIGVEGGMYLLESGGNLCDLDDTVLQYVRDVSEELSPEDEHLQDRGYSGHFDETVNHPERKEFISY